MPCNCAAHRASVKAALASGSFKRITTTTSRAAIALGRNLLVPRFSRKAK